MAGYTREDDGAWTWYGNAALTIRPSTWMELNPAIYYQRTRNERAWVYPDGSVFDPAVAPARFSVFGDTGSAVAGPFAARDRHVHADAQCAVLHAGVPDARRQYDDYYAVSCRQVCSRRTTTGATRRITVTTSTAVTVNANVLLRWEYLPGSTMYLVWTQARYGDNGLYGLGLNAGVTGRAAAAEGRRAHAEGQLLVLTVKKGRRKKEKGRTKRSDDQEERPFFVPTYSFLLPFSFFLLPCLHPSVFVQRTPRSS